MVFGQLIKTDNYGKKDDAGKLKKTHLSGAIVHSFATLTFNEQFTITDNNNCSIYINPPEGCVVYNVKAKYNDNLTEFVIHKLEEPVYNGYNDINSNSDAISLNLGMIPYLTTVTIEITCTFTAILSADNSIVFNIPTESNYLNSLFSTDINISMLKTNIPHVKLSEGALNIVKNHLILSPFKLTKPFQIAFNFEAPIESAAFYAQIDSFDYIGLSIHPTELKQNLNLKQEIYLVIDCSGSMAGSKIKNARVALKNFLNALPDNCYYNILRFGSTFERMFEHSVPNNKENIEKSMNFATMLEANLGGTDAYSPLMSIIEEKQRKGYLRQVFILTDGEFNDKTFVLSACTSNRNIMRVFPFGIGNDVDHAYLKDLAKSTMGEAHFIQKCITNDDISNAVLLTLKSSQVSAIINAQIHIEDIDTFEIAPHPIPSLFTDSLAHVIVRFEKKNISDVKSILITGETGDSIYEEAVQVVKTGNLINYQKLFAYHNIRDMEDKLINIKNSEESAIMRENIIRLSMQCNVVSSFTGMFTVINGVEQTARQQQGNSLNQGQNQYLSIIQSSQYQQQSSIPAQQGMSQRQCWAQMAYEQTYIPMQQQAQNWGNSQQSYYQQPQQINYDITNSNNHEIQQEIVYHNSFIEQEQNDTNQSNSNFDLPMNENDETPQIDGSLDPFLYDLLKKQKNDGSWDDTSIIKNLVISKKINTTVYELINEFPSVDKKLKNLRIDCIITLIVIGWIYSQRPNSYSSLKKQIKKSLDFVRSNTNISISDDITKNFNIVNGFTWKFQAYFL